MGKPAVKERTPEAAPASIDNGTCRHHWIIESPHGALSDGRCKICGEERQFRGARCRRSLGGRDRPLGPDHGKQPRGPIRGPLFVVRAVPLGRARLLTGASLLSP